MDETRPVSATKGKLGKRLSILDDCINKNEADACMMSIIKSLAI